MQGAAADRVEGAQPRLARVPAQQPVDVPALRAHPRGVERGGRRLAQPPVDGRLEPQQVGLAEHHRGRHLQIRPGLGQPVQDRAEGQIAVPVHLQAPAFPGVVQLWQRQRQRRVDDEDHGVDAEQEAQRRIGPYEVLAAEVEEGDRPGLPAGVGEQKGLHEAREAVQAEATGVVQHPAVAQRLHAFPYEPRVLLRVDGLPLQAERLQTAVGDLGDHLGQQMALAGGGLADHRDRQRTAVGEVGHRDEVLGEVRVRGALLDGGAHDVLAPQGVAQARDVQRLVLHLAVGDEQRGEVELEGLQAVRAERLGVAPLLARPGIAGRLGGGRLPLEAQRVLVRLVVRACVVGGGGECEAFGGARSQQVEQPGGRRPVGRERGERARQRPGEHPVPGQVGGRPVGGAGPAGHQLVEHLGGAPHRVPGVDQALAPALFGRAVGRPAPPDPRPSGAGHPLQPPQLDRGPVPEHGGGRDTAQDQALAVQHAQRQQQIAGEDPLIARGHHMGARGGGAAGRGVEQERLGGVEFVADDLREERGELRVVEHPVQMQGGARLRVQQGARRGVRRVGGGQPHLDELLPLVVEQAVADPLGQQRIAAGFAAQADRGGAAPSRGGGEGERGPLRAARLGHVGMRGAGHQRSPSLRSYASTGSGLWRGRTVSTTPMRSGVSRISPA